jgi:hypothetical protein
MSDRIAEAEIARLTAAVGCDPGSSEFPALAEALRGAGRLPEAEQAARQGLAHKPGCLEGSLVLALVLLDQGRIDEARRELAARASESLSAHGIEADISDSELDRAFDVAEPDRDQLVDADRVAQEAMRDADLDRPEELASDAIDPEFATGAMAELLERQGDSDGASRIRAALEVNAEAANATSAPPRAARERTIATLEQWLRNLRRKSG